MKFRIPRRPSAGFSIIELLIVLLFFSTILLIGVPSLQRLFGRSKIEGAAREATLLMQQTRLEALKRNVPTVVALDEANTRFFAFADVDGAAAGDPPDSLFNPVAGADRGTTDYRIGGDLDIGDRVLLEGPGAGAASDGLAVAGGFPVAVFLPNGSVNQVGSFRFADLTQLNHYEIRIAPQATGRIVLRKFYPDDTAWYESGVTKRSWEWYYE